MAISIYAIQTFTATDGTSCTKGNVYSVTDSAAFIAYQRGQAQPAALQEDVNLSTINQVQYQAGAVGLVASTASGDFVLPNGQIRQLNQSNQMLRQGFTPDRIIATGNDGIGVAGGWSVAGGSLSLDAVNVRRQGNPVLKVIGATGTPTNTYVRRKITPTPLTSSIDVALLVQKPSTGTVEVLIGWTSTAPGNDPPNTGFTNTRQMYMSASEIALGCWTVVKAAPASSRYSTGRPQGRAWYSTEALPANIQGLEVQIVWTGVPDAEKVAYIDVAAINGKTKPMVMIGFDGFYSSQATVALPLMQKYGFKGYAASSGNNIAPSRATTDALYNAGWDIISQAQRSADYGVNATNLASDLISAKSQFLAAGYLRAVDWFAYPFNSRSSATDSILAANGYKFAGSSAGASFVQSNIGDGGLLQIGRYTTDQNNTAAQMQSALDEAILNGAHMMLYGHDLVSSVTVPATQTSIAEFTSFLAYLATQYYAGLVDVVTPSEFAQRI